MRLSDISAVKVLGRSIGFVGKPSEVDGDGDGFLTGPDGRDNVPAPKRVVDVFADAARALSRGGEPPARLPIPDGWFVNRDNMDIAKRNFPDIHLRWDGRRGRYLPATGTVKPDAGGYELFQDANLAGGYLVRDSWHPAMVPADSPVARVMRVWRSDFAESRAMTQALAGMKVPDKFDTDDFRADVELLREALGNSPELRQRSYRTARLTADVGDSVEVGSELNFSAAAVAANPTDAQAYSMDELSGVAGLGEKLMFEFPEDTRGLFFDEAGEMASGRPGARGGERGNPVEGVVSGRFRVAKIERREFKHPSSGRPMSRDVVVLERVPESKSLRLRLV